MKKPKSTNQVVWGSSHQPSIPKDVQLRIKGIADKAFKKPETKK